MATHHLREEAPPRPWRTALPTLSSSRARLRGLRDNDAATLAAIFTVPVHLREGVDVAR